MIQTLSPPRSCTSEYGKLPLLEQKRPGTPHSWQAPREGSKAKGNSPRTSRHALFFSWGEGLTEGQDVKTTVQLQPQSRKHRSRGLNFLTYKYQDLTNKLKGAFQWGGYGLRPLYKPEKCVWAHIPGLVSHGSGCSSNAASSGLPHVPCCPGSGVHKPVEAHSPTEMWVLSSPFYRCSNWLPEQLNTAFTGAKRRVPSCP